MTRDDIIRLARKADPFGEDGKLHALAELTPETVARFAALIAAAERESCASICHELKMKNKFENADGQYDDWNHGIAHGAELCRDAIRARKNT